MPIQETDTCLRSHNGEKCQGALGERWTDAGTRIVECRHHMETSLQRNEELRERYPNSSMPPSWFDESNAGESWNDD